jgi:hypothetical protein
MPRAGLAGLGVPLAAASERGISRLGNVRRDAGPGQLLRDVPPAGAPLQRERNIIPAGEPRQPGPQVHTVSRSNLAPLHLPRRGVQVVERELLPADIQAATGYQPVRAPLRPRVRQLKPRNGLRTT